MENILISLYVLIFIILLHLLNKWSRTRLRKVSKLIPNQVIRSEQLKYLHPGDYVRLEYLKEGKFLTYGEYIYDGKNSEFIYLVSRGSSALHIIPLDKENSSLHLFEVAEDEGILLCRMIYVIN